MEMASKRLTKLHCSSSEWASLEYSLQLSLSSTAPVLKEVFAVASAHLTTAFDRRAQGALVLDCWQDCAALGAENSLEEVCSRGFKVPANGLCFTAGTVKLKEELAYGRIHECLLVKVAVGRSFAIKAETLEAKHLKVPADFDSMYIYYESDTSTYQHDYIVFEAAQALPCFVVQFELDPSREEALKSPLCDMCQESTAEVFCEADEACLCRDCDEEHHTRGNKLMQRHRRMALQDRPKRFGFCAFHPDSQVEFYCTVCRSPLCSSCKVMGSHSTPDTLSHPIVKVLEAYQRAQLEAREVDPLLDQRKAALAQLLGRVDERLQQLKQCSEDVEARIYKLLGDALLQLQEEHQKKVSALLSAQLELKRQSEEVAWVEGFLEYQRGVLSPPLFLQAWERHLSHRGDLRSADQAVELPSADLRLEGALQVVAEQRAKASALDSLSGQSTPSVSSKFRSQLFSRLQISTPPNLKVPAKSAERALPLEDVNEDTD